MNEQKEPLVVSFGAGVDSTAMLIEMRRRGIRPDLILFADTGAEKPETYEHLEKMKRWCKRAAFPEITVVRYEPKRVAYRTLEEECLTNETLPSLAFGLYLLDQVEGHGPAQISGVVDAGPWLPPEDNNRHRLGRRSRRSQKDIRWRKGQRPPL